MQANKQLIAHQLSFDKEMTENSVTLLINLNESNILQVYFA